MESIPTMTNLLTIPHNVGRLIVEDGAMLCRRLLGTDRFVQFCRKRGITIDRSRLIRLERLGLFAPVFRVRTPQQPTDEFHIPPREGNNWFAKGLAEDTTAVPSNHVVPAHTDQNCEGYYSVFQINHLHHVLSRMTTSFPLDYYLEQSTCRPIDWQEKLDQRMEIARMRASRLRDCQYHRAVALLCQHISNRYFPETQTDMRTQQIGYGSYEDAWITVSSPDWNWRREAQRWDPERIETLYSLTPEKLQKAYKGLAMDQSDCDPIEVWYSLTQFISIDQRKKLRGAALRSETIRYGAQMLRLLYKDLYGDDLPHPSEVYRTIGIHLSELEVRKDTRRYLEFVANRFGINPQPRLCLFVEGQTEEFAVTRIFEEYYGLHPGTCGVEVICLRGVGQATGNKRDRFSGIIRLIDYLHHHQTFSFLILDNENDANQLEKKLCNARSIHGHRKFVTKRKYIKILRNSFEFDNFSDTEIATALTKLAQNKVTFRRGEVDHARQDRNSGSALKNLYKEKVNYGLNKIELAKLLIDTMVSPESRRKIENRPIVKVLEQIIRRVVCNPLPVSEEDRDINQRSGAFG